LFVEYEKKITVKEKGDLIPGGRKERNFRKGRKKFPRAEGGFL